MKFEVENLIHPAIKHSLGFDPNESDSEFLEQWKKRTSNARKPCWDLKYCPYGELVEQFPLLPTTRKKAISHNEYLKGCLEKGILGVEPNVKPMNEKMRTLFTQQVAEFNPDNHPEDIPLEIREWACLIFGHICPVVFAAENVAEEPS
ncbi:MAG: hypothetical protein HWN66_14960 [Candidatus Helarchaeota archaeon]|nr:hypothetical protein [Candidatus Helarchaeota archaeon]